MHPLLLLTKEAVETFIREKKVVSPPLNTPIKFLSRKAGTFITIEKDGKMRACMGTYLPTKVNLVEEIISNAISAAIRDHRFPPISEDELPFLSYTLYILSNLELVKNRKELNPKEFGIVVRTGPLAFPGEEDVVFNGVFPSKTGLLLPDLEGIDTVEQQISLACQKGGIDLEKEKIIIYKFTVEKYQ